MTYAADERVDAYIDALPDWQQAICRQVRELVHAADPEVSETIKRSRQPYFVFRATSARCLRPGIMSTYSSTTAALSLIRTGS